MASATPLGCESVVLELAIVVFIEVQGFSQFILFVDQLIMPILHHKVLLLRK